MKEREQRIREWAYRLWEQDGYPHGRDGEHWFRATEIVLLEESTPTPEAAGALPETAPEATAPVPEAAAAPAPKVAKPRKASAGPKVTEAPEPTPAPAARRKRS